MEYFNGLQCITGGDFILSLDNPEGIVTFDNYKKMKKRGHIRVVRRGCLNTPALIEWSSIPEKYKEMLRERGIEPTTKKESQLSKMIDIDLDAREFYAGYMLADGRYLPEEKQQEYTANAEVLNAISKIISNRLALRKALGGSTRNIWPKIAEQTAALRPRINHTLPDNHRRLSDRLKKYKQSSYVSLISGKWLNYNAKKVVDAEQQATLRELLRKHNNFDNVQIADLYNMLADKLEWAKISSSTVSNYRKKWNLETFGGQRGESAFDNSKAMLVKRKAPTLPLVYWTVDGWDVELLYQKTETDSKGYAKTTYHNRLTMVVVLDPCKKYPVGYAVGTHETPALNC